MHAYITYDHTFIITATVITPLTLQLSSENYTVVESNGSVCITVMADRPASEPFIVYLVPMGMWHQSASCECAKLFN